MELAQSERDELLSTIARQDEKIRMLEQQMRLLVAGRFAPKSEKISPDQLALFAAQKLELPPEEPEQEETVQVTFERKRRGKRTKLDEDLERQRIEYQLSEEACQCGCGGQLTKIDEVVSEQLELVPAHYIVLQHVQFKYACKSCQETIQLAPKAPQPIEKANAAPGLLAHIVTTKFVDGVPFARQEKQHARHGVIIPRNTMARWIIQLADLILPLINLMEDIIRAGPFIQCDETPYQVLKESGRKPTAKSYFWVRRGGPDNQVVVIFTYDPSRSSAVARQLFTDYTGYVQCDGYGGYHPLETTGITLLGCMAHVRRKYCDALKALPSKDLAQKSLAAEAIRTIKKLYAVEKESKDHTPEQRYELRQEKSVPLLTEFKAWLDEQILVVLPKSVLGKAISYTLNQWPRLVRYCDNGCLHIDNNADERAIRPLAIGRKNFLFSDTPEGAHANARMFSLIETCKLHGHEPCAYLRQIFKELPKAKTVENYESLLPWNLDAESLKQSARKF
jgi:transposase